MVDTLSNGARAALLPVGAVDFMKRRLAEAAGLILFICAGAVLIAVATYSPHDPSLNSAADGAVVNLLGIPGAYAADILVQILGVSGILPVLVLAAWGWRLFSKQAVTRPIWRFVAVIVAAAMLAIALGAVDAPRDWPLSAGLGGAAGTLMLDPLARFLAQTGIEEWMIASLCAALGAGALVAALGLSWADCKRIGGGFVGVVLALRRAFDWCRTAAGNLGNHDTQFEVERTEPNLDTPAQAARRETKTKRAQPDLVAPRAQKAKTGRKAKAASQGKLALEPGDEFQFPPLDLLTPGERVRSTTVSEQALAQNARLLESVLEDFGVHGEIVKVRPGPVVTLYELEPAPGTKTSRVIGLSDDIARSMSAVSVRAAVIPGRNVIGIELPNVRREMVHLRELLGSDTFERRGGKLSLALGKDIGGGTVAVDLARMPHLLIAGTTGSGKSVAINTMILSLLYRHRPDACKLIMIDPKMLELSVYEGIPHLLAPVVTEPGKAVVALKWAVREMEERYRAMSQLGVRNIDGYNARLADARKRGEELTRRVQTGFDENGKPVFEEQPLPMDALPFIVVVVDEMADLMLVAGKDIEAAVQRLAQMARAAGIHLIMATQRPSVDVITGTIKANFPTRVSFQVTSKIDSRTILGEQGAEQLLGQGDMLYMAGGGRITRVHGPFVSDEEVEDVVSFLKSQGAPDYVEAVTEEEEGGFSDMLGGSGGNSGDELYDQAVALIAREGKASTSFIQRHLQIGYNRAARIIERMEGEGVVSKADRVGRREVLIGGGEYAN
ncbi:MAG: cell division protein FtsK [Rhodospirillales bacterium]|jgi:DNA segregation ATPase FtsK/SpoIIIE, S-DNA-T family|nr:cell division protein FtsK [Rhodospirillales bacterium]